MLIQLGFRIARLNLPQPSNTHPSGTCQLRLSDPVTSAALFDTSAGNLLDGGENQPVILGLKSSSLYVQAPPDIVSKLPMALTRSAYAMHFAHAVKGYRSHFETIFQIVPLPSGEQPAGFRLIGFGAISRRCGPYPSRWWRSYGSAPRHIWCRAKARELRHIPKLCP